MVRRERQLTSCADKCWAIGNTEKESYKRNRVRIGTSRGCRKRAEASSTVAWEVFQSNEHRQIKKLDKNREKQKVYGVCCALKYRNI